MVKQFNGISFDVATLEVNGAKYKSKSDLFKALYDAGMEICEISRETESHYSFVYGVISNAREIKPVQKVTKSDAIRDLARSGLTCAQIAKQTNSHYSFVFGVIKRMKEAGEEFETNAEVGTEVETVEDAAVVEVLEKVDRYIKHKKSGQQFEVVEANDEEWTISTADGKEKVVKVSTIKRYYEELV